MWKGAKLKKKKLKIKYLYSDEAQMQSLSQIIVIAYENGPAFAKMMLIAQDTEARQNERRQH